MSDNNLTPDDLYAFLRTAGFEIRSTGGGCTAWMLDLAGAKSTRRENVYVMVTNDADHDFGSEQDVAEEGILVSISDNCAVVWHRIAMHCNDVPLLVARAMVVGPQLKGDNQ